MNDTTILPSSAPAASAPAASTQPASTQAASAPAAAARPAGPRRRFWARLGREPLLHFCLLAGLIFGLDRVLHPPSKSERVILISKQMRQELIDRFDEDKLVKPTPKQLQQLIDFYVATEILYREGKSMGLERGDDMIRSRIAHKLQLLIFSDIDVGDPSEPQLAAWFAANHGRFDTPEKFDFYLADAQSEQEARALVDKIARGEEPDSLREAARVFQGRPAQSVVDVFGEAFRTQLATLPRGSWQAAQSKEGWHVVRVDGVTDAVAATLDSVRPAARQEWKTEETRRRALEAVGRLKTSYTIIDEGAP